MYILRTIAVVKFETPSAPSAIAAILARVPPPSLYRMNANEMMKKKYIIFKKCAHLRKIALLYVHDWMVWQSERRVRKDSFSAGLEVAVTTSKRVPCPC